MIFIFYKLFINDCDALTDVDIYCTYVKEF